ncbi:DUF1415 domain-containing protein [Alteromonas ponticola]|uniref:DUF1415 domain-containing protein n=1 Tax=Alteromonas ponticola TaxID=2720613 RepID=A0ABX1QXK6_9ALTE|nr:DUF1415 domain-containing protein [Alteromonas ponticola]NMH58982.1 DUF1415 domain-containing protein [Alteromonas ponticola]
MTVDSIKQWLDEIVIGQNFCPFARYVRDNQQIRFVENTQDTLDEALLSLHQEILTLESDEDVATTLIIFSSGFTDFDDYLDLLTVANELLDEWGYAGEYQLASFHPDYLFEGEAESAASHYTNRAPYPVLHILRESDVENVLAHCPNPEAIYENNQVRAHELGVKWFRQKLSAYRQK